eukprot:CAMPEP_0194392758 /NCGR_PEP_ID=MMETSP0174-20130528/122921_1 /TAXON_ID=216777 /ORGANISM="Proboscia alata, Strain PI-D3" /LENGTH=188 /DNA_ID=CAMNT_0039188365 /DNA_START=71 /DNA_END=637 /DNA_ORIENTATION=+
MGQTQSVQPNHPPLYYCCRYQRDYEEAIKLVSSNPEEASYRDSNLETILHHVVRHFHPSLDAVKAISAAYPEALHTVNNTGRTPLHVAAYCCSPSVVEYLVRESPSVAKVLDSEGYTPLDLSIKFRRDDNASAIVSVFCDADTFPSVCAADISSNKDTNEMLARILAEESIRVTRRQQNGPNLITVCE